MVGLLATVIILTFCTEHYFSSPGFVERQQRFSCLVNYLHQQNITDNFFPATAESQSKDDISNCSNVVHQLRLKIDSETKNQLYETKGNVTATLCEEIERNSTTTRGEENHHPKINSPPSDDNLKNLKLEEENCRKLSRCFACIKGYLQSDDYENFMLHAKAVNFTVIEFRVWEYFRVSERVEELLNEANALKLKSVSGCESEGKC